MNKAIKFLKNIIKTILFKEFLNKTFNSFYKYFDYMINSNNSATTPKDSIISMSLGS
jgi:hypothetical protein